MTGVERFLAAVRRQPVDRTPIWFMRQAGRCLVEYRELRERYDILTMTRTPELATQVTLMPVTEFGVDAAVLYADIMLPLFIMGVPFRIDPGVGPLIDSPVRTRADVDRLRIDEPKAHIPEIFEAIRMVRRELGGRTAVIGFAGAPFTVASYLIEGRPTREYALAKGLMYAEPDTWHSLMETLTEVTIAYLRDQIEAGVQVVQLFDSWAGALSRRDFETHVLPYSRRILESVQAAGIPTIHFATMSAHLLDLMAGPEADAVSVDWRLPLDTAWDRIGHDHAIQGNLDPVAAAGPWEVLETEARRVLAEAGGRPGHIFNLGHGVLADTPQAQLRRLVDLVHTVTEREAAATS